MAEALLEGRTEGQGRKQRMGDQGDRVADNEDTSDILNH